MLRAIQLAQGGNGTVSPNPMVGSVIVHNNKIIGEGFHHHSGAPHAEVMAIRSVQDKSKLAESCIYVTLEPCSHYGKTPPCSSLIIQNKIPQVVISCQDPNEKVAGKGIQMLRENGIEVIENVLQTEGEWLNRRFFTFHRKQRPYIILKWAQSKDKFIDIDRKKNQQGVFWLTKPLTKLVTHRWRAHEDAILVGKNTALIDNPSLTTRNYFGKSPLRIVIDKNLQIPETNHIFNQKVPTLVFHSIKNPINKKNLEFIRVPSNEEYIPTILKTLYRKDILSIIIEGGRYTINEFVKAKMWDEARILTASSWLGNGTKAPKIQGLLQELYQFGDDQISIFVPRITE